MHRGALPGAGPRSLTRSRGLYVKPARVRLLPGNWHDPAWSVMAARWHHLPRGRWAVAPRPPLAAGSAGPGQGRTGQGRRSRHRHLAGRCSGCASGQGAEELAPADRRRGGRRHGPRPGRRPGRRDQRQHLHLSVLRPRSLSVPGAVTRTGLGSEQAGLRSRWAPGVRRVERTRPPTYLRTPVTASALHANRQTAPASGEWFTGAVCLPPAGGA
jgi:hypothetical protein